MAEGTDIFGWLAGGGAAGAGAIIAQVVRGFVGERLEARRQRRNGNGEVGGDHGTDSGRHERRTDGRAQIAVMRDLGKKLDGIHDELRGLRSDTRELNVRTQHVEAGVEALRRGEGCG